jgi:enoyl-CoA hydratase/carnithine racemase
VKLGLVPDVGGTTRSGAHDRPGEGEGADPDRAHDSRQRGAADGAPHEVAPDGTHVEAAIRLAEEIAQNAPLAVGLAKRLVDLGADTDAHTFQAMELLVQSVLLKTDDAAEGSRALAERRPPRFTGR